MKKPYTPIIDNVERGQMLRFAVLLIDATQDHLPRQVNKRILAKKMLEEADKIIEQICSRHPQAQTTTSEELSNEQG